MRSKVVSSLSPLWRSPLARSSLRTPTISFQQRRGLAEDKTDLGGVDGSEPPGPQPNKHNWIAGTITVSAVLFIGYRMMAAKSKDTGRSPADRAA